MPAPRARQIIVTTAERHRLEKLAYSHTAGYQQVPASVAASDPGEEPVPDAVG